MDGEGIASSVVALSRDCKRKEWERKGKKEREEDGFIGDGDFGEEWRDPMDYGGWRCDWDGFGIEKGKQRRRGNQHVRRMGKEGNKGRNNEGKRIRTKKTR